MTLEEFREGIQREKNRRKEAKLNKEAIDKDNRVALYINRKNRLAKEWRHHRR